MTPKINLSFALMVLIAFVTIQPCSAADYETVIMKPYKIILTTEGASDNTIQANIPMAVGIDISDFQAYLTLAGTDIEAVGFDYCPIDDILHVYFDRLEVVEFLIAEDISGELEVTVWGSFFDGFTDITFDGKDDVELVTPIEDTQYQNKEHKKE